MHELLSQYLDSYRSDTNFRVDEWVESKVTHFAEHLKSQCIKQAVLLVSGGIDSALTAALLHQTHTKYPDILEKYHLVAVPVESSNWALERSQELAQSLNHKLNVLNLSLHYDELYRTITKELEIQGNDFTRGQGKSYLRTTVAYTCAQLFTSLDGTCVVMGTGNKDEDGYLAYFCKAGDGVVDIQLISDLHKSQVYKAAKYMGVPDSICNAAPSADLWPGQEDEEELGFSYDFVELYTGYYLNLSDGGQRDFIKNLAVKNVTALTDFLEKEEMILAVHNRNKHKLEGVVNL